MVVRNGSQSSIAVPYAIFDEGVIELFFLEIKLREIQLTLVHASESSK